jgi:N,N'-diacetylbacillosaminyl-diphospho-undecaprenol alpha-1,3-N-acetylgalactosaminyltransferase
MKIAFLSHYDFNLYRFRLPIMKELVKNNHTVYAISPKGNVSHKFKEFNIKHIDYNINRKSLNLFFEIKNIFNIYRAVQSENIDILHTFTMKPNIYGSFISFFSKRKVICSITGLGSFYIDTNLKSKIIKFITKTLYKIASIKASYFIFQNEDDKNFFLNENIITKDKSILIRGSGIDTKEFNPKNIDNEIVKEIKSSLKIIKENLVITMIARIIKQKGVLEFIKAIDLIKNKYPQIKAIFIGDSDDGNTFNMNNDLIKNNKNIHYIPFSNNIKEYLFITDLYVLPSYREGLSMSLLEACSMEKAIVTTNAVGCKDVVDENINGFLCETGNANSLYLAIDKFMKIENKKILGLASRIKVKKEFSVDIVIDKHIKLYNSLKKNKAL